MQGKQRRIAADDGFPSEPVEQVGSPLAEVDDPRSHAFGVEAQPQDVDRRLEQLGRNASGQERYGAVGGDHPPVTIHDEGRIWLVAARDALEHLAYRPHLGRIEVVLCVGGCVARS